MSNTAIALQSITKRFGTVTAADNITLEIFRGEFFSLLGPSGCGKTTLLRLIGGFENPDAGELMIDGRDMRRVPPQDRPVNTVFQSYALFPHLNVFDNVAFGLRMKGVASAELKRRANDALELAHIVELRNRFPAELSGGQRQRVALARAIVNEPAVLLLDEPLAAIDAKLRANLQTELRNLQRELKTTFVYVTHDQDEALALSDRIAVLKSGGIAQCGAPVEVYQRPQTRFVAEFIGACNILSGRVVSGGSGIETAIGLVTSAGRISGPAACIGIRREHWTISDSVAPAENLFRGKIVDRAYAGSETEYTVDVSGVLVNVLHPCSAEARALGEIVAITCSPESVIILEDS